MKRIAGIALPLVAAALFVVGPVAATTKHHGVCKQVRSELAAGKSSAEIAKELKVSKATIAKCNPKVASSKQHRSSSQQQAQ